MLEEWWCVCVGGDITIARVLIYHIAIFLTCSMDLINSKIVQISDQSLYNLPHCTMHNLDPYVEWNSNETFMLGLAHVILVCFQ